MHSVHDGPVRAFAARWRACARSPRRLKLGRYHRAVCVARRAAFVLPAAILVDHDQHHCAVAEKPNLAGAVFR